MNQKTHLLCTFTKNRPLHAFSKILEKYKVCRQLSLFELIGHNDQILIYDVYDNITCDIPDTILVHKKASTNTFYTINALNEIIKNNNNGILDISLKINWDDYADCILLYTQKEGLRISKLRYIDHILFEN